MSTNTIFGKVAKGDVSTIQKSGSLVRTEPPPNSGTTGSSNATPINSSQVSSASGSQQSASSKSGTPSTSNPKRASAIASADTAASYTKNTPIVPPSKSPDLPKSVTDPANAGTTKTSNIDVESLVHEYEVLDPSDVKSIDYATVATDGLSHIGVDDPKCGAAAKACIPGGWLDLGLLGGLFALLMGLLGSLFGSLFGNGCSSKQAECALGMAMALDRPDAVTGLPDGPVSTNAIAGVTKKAGTKGNVSFLNKTKSKTTQSQRTAAVNDNPRPVANNVLASNGEHNTVEDIREVDPNWDSNLEPQAVDNVVDYDRFTDDEARNVSIAETVQDTPVTPQLDNVG